MTFRALPGDASWGMDASSASLYGCRGRSKSSATAVRSTTCPAYMTADLVGDVGDDAEIVGHEDHGHVPLLLQGGQQLEDLGLGGDVERGGGLVGDEQLGLARQGHGDHDPLAHPAGEGMGIVAGPARRIGDTHLVEHVHGAGPTPRPD